MYRLLRLLGVGLLVTIVAGGSTVVMAEGTPGAATPSPRASYTYDPAQPIIVISSGPMTATLRVDWVPTDSYGAVTVATASDAPFRFSIVPPQGEARTIFRAESPDAFTGALLLDQTGDYTLTVEATGSWALIIR